MDEERIEVAAKKLPLVNDGFQLNGNELKLITAQPLLVEAIKAALHQRNFQSAERHYTKNFLGADVISITFAEGTTTDSVEKMLDGAGQELNKFKALTNVAGSGVTAKATATPQGIVVSLAAKDQGQLFVSAQEALRQHGSILGQSSAGNSNGNEVNFTIRHNATVEQVQELATALTSAIRNNGNQQALQSPKAERMLQVLQTIPNAEVVYKRNNQGEFDFTCRFPGNQALGDAIDRILNNSTHTSSPDNEYQRGKNSILFTMRDSQVNNHFNLLIDELRKAITNSQKQQAGRGNQNSTNRIAGQGIDQPQVISPIQPQQKIEKSNVDSFDTFITYHENGFWLDASVFQKESTRGDRAAANTFIGQVNTRAKQNNYPLCLTPQDNDTGHPFIWAQPIGQGYTVADVKSNVKRWFGKYIKTGSITGDSQELVKPAESTQSRYSVAIDDAFGEITPEQRTNAANQCIKLLNTQNSQGAPFRINYVEKEGRRYIVSSPVTLDDAGKEKFASDMQLLISEFIKECKFPKQANLQVYQSGLSKRQQENGKWI